MSLTKSSMRNLLLRRKGIGVKVITVTGESFFFFYEDFDDSKGITRARKHFRFNEHLVFSQTNGHSSQHLLSIWIITKSCSPLLKIIQTILPYKKPSRTTKILLLLAYDNIQDFLQEKQQNRFWNSVSLLTNLQG